MPKKLELQRIRLIFIKIDDATALVGKNLIE